MYRVLVSDGIAEEGAKILKAADGIDVVIHKKLPKEDLLACIADFDALIIRSASKVTEEVLDKAVKLKVIGRAGIGVDNVDVPAATKRGIVVMNTPYGNTITTAEHALSMMMAMTRNIPAATASMKAGQWEKSKYTGREIYNKTLGVLGAGNIGSIVIDRAKGLKMNVIAYDPFLTPEAAQKKGVELVTIDELFARAHYITIHVPKMKETINLVNKDTIAKMRDGVFIINCARGGIVNEMDLYEALKSGKIAGAACDVFEQEPVDPKHPLLTLENFVCTPHLGASTHEAQVNVSVDVAEQIVDFLKRNIIVNAVNVPALSSEELVYLNPFLNLLEKMGAFLAQIVNGAVKEMVIQYDGDVADKKVNVLTIAALKGFLATVLDQGEVNFVNATSIAKERGMAVVEERGAPRKDYSNLITITAKTADKTALLAGTLFGNEPRILKINNLPVECVPEGHMIMAYNHDKPGVIGNIGSLMGKLGINIGTMTFGRDMPGGTAISLLHIDSKPSKDVLDEMAKLPNITSVANIEI